MTSKTEYAEDFIFFFYMNSNNNLTLFFSYLISLLHATFTTLRHAKAKHILFHILFHNHYLYLSITSSSSSRSHHNNFFPFIQTYTHILMKFGKRIKEQIQESLPEWRDKFLRYKELKNLISSPAPAESIFVGLLNAEIEKFNAFFVEQEEDFIIHHKELQYRIQRLVEKCGDNDDVMFREEIGEIRKDIVNFHGEMVLLVNYSNINYTGLTKILKKYDKRTGGALRSPFIQKVLRQPFFKTDLVSRLVREWETTMDAMFPALTREVEGYERSAAVSSAAAGEGIFRNTVAALMTMREMRRGSSTYGAYSLPPLNLSDSDLVLRPRHVPSPIPIPY
ncbi:unnamed protein product [Brassica oleracea]